jgi:predicted nucleic-acid-binding Zn-ribbon protein
MPEIIKCAKCADLLYFGEEIARRLYMRAVPSEETVLTYYDNICPRCGNRLTMDSVTIEIKRRNKHVS